VNSIVAILSSRAAGLLKTQRRQYAGQQNAGDQYEPGNIRLVLPFD
jgi:hypothetical protein